MIMDNPSHKEKKRKLSDGKESLQKYLKKEKEDIKPNIEVISRTIKKEPEITLREIKQEPDFMFREIKKEPKESDNESVTDNVIEPELRKRKRTVKKTRKKVRKNKATKVRKRTTKNKKSTPKKKSKSSLGSKKSASKRKTKTRKNKKKISKRASNQAHAKKERKTLLDVISDSRLRLFGFADELEYFPPESNPEEPKEVNSESGSGISGKRTRLSGLNVRKKIASTLKNLFCDTPKPKPKIVPPVNKNVDILGSILESQALWHSKNPDMKVNEDGSVEVKKKINTNKIKTELTCDKKINLQKSRMSGMDATQKRSNSDYLRQTAGEPVLSGSLNSNEKVAHLTEKKIKTEVCGVVEIDKNEEKTRGGKIKIEKNTKEDSPSRTPTVLPLQEPTSFSSEYLRSPVKAYESDIEIIEIKLNE